MTNDSSEQETTTERSRPVVTIENCMEKWYSVVYVRCKDRPKLFFDTVCTLTDMQYVVFHATVNAEGQEANQVFFIHTLIINNHSFFLFIPFGQIVAFFL